jgi:flagellar biogenesis protein FliO
VDTVFLALRVIVSLGAVLGALWFGHRWVTKGRPGLKFQAKPITVAARHGLGAKAGVAIVEADGRRYLLGVTEHSVTVLDRLDGQAAPAGQQTALTVVTSTGPVPAVGAASQAETRVVSVLSTGPVPAVGGQETRVVSVMTTGPVSTESLVAGAATGATRTFEQQLAFAASFTDTISLPPAAPAGPLPDVFRIEPARSAAARSGSADGGSAHDASGGASDPSPQPLTRRAAREAEAAQAASAKAVPTKAASAKAASAKAASASPSRSSASPLAGSILSPETWRQTAAALKRAR